MQHSRGGWRTVVTLLWKCGRGGGGDVNKNFSRLGSPLRPFIPRINDCGSGPAPCPARRESRGRPAGLGRAAGARRAAARGGRRGRSGGAAGAERCAGPGWRCPGAWRLPAPACPPLPPPFPPHRGAFPAAFPRRTAPRRGVPGLPSPEAPPLSPRGISRARNHPASPRAVVPPGRPSFSPRPPAPSPGSLLHPPGKPAGSCPFPTCRAAPRPGCGAGSAPRLPRARGGSSELEVGKRCKGGRLLDCQPRSQLGGNKFVSLSLHTYTF